MPVKVWIINETLQVQQLTPEYLEETLNLYDTSFYSHENVSNVLGVSQDPGALLELRELKKAAAKDGVSVIAIDKTTRKVVGAALNKIQTKTDTAFANFSKSWKHEPSKLLVEFMAQVDDICNLFEYCKVDCLFEFMFLVVAPEYGKRGIGRKLGEASLEIARDLSRGNNVKKSIDGTQLSLEPVPKIITAIFSTFKSQKIGRSLGFTIVAEERYDTFDFHGKNFAEVIKSGTPTFTLEYKRL